jgi:hypothetical protein
LIYYISIHLASKGNGANLLKAGIKRRRTKEEILDQKQEEELRQQQIQQNLQHMEQLQQKCQQLEEQVKVTEPSDKILREFVAKGVLVVDENNVIHVAENPPNAYHDQEASNQSQNQGNAPENGEMMD